MAAPARTRDHLNPSVGTCSRDKMDTMLLELSITNFAIIDQLRLRLGPDFNVFTGETGAGKSILIDAVSALVGDRVGADVVRAGADRALIEGVFELTTLLDAEHAPAAAPAMSLATNGAADDAAGADSSNDDELSLRSLLASLGLEAEDGTLILTREVARTGRSIARVNGRTVPTSALQRIAAALIDTHGQSTHLTLLRPEQHIFYLDRYAGCVAQRTELTALVAQQRSVRRELAALQRDEHEIERRAELLRFQVGEIEAARPRQGELETLERERRLLANAERVGELCAGIHGALVADDTGDGPAALDLLAAARRALDELVRLDPTLADQATALDDAVYRLEDVGAAIRSYQDAVGVDPARLAVVEERLDLLARLRRKYGATIAEMLAYAATAAGELERMTHRDERASTLREEDAQLCQRIGALATRLSHLRQHAATDLSAAMERELDQLHMRRARFQIQIQQTPDPAGVPAQLHAAEADGAPSGGHASERYACGPTGIDRVEFLIAPNQGEPFKPLARIASGGETSRLMLALKTILAAADEVPILIFDEVDAGISGRAGQVVGEKL
ncbi:MAG TPA: DNA repair protein RecN, partial [Ktedonobacterales bacterium]|nr:DNA repair protein RecN [Ktedonobacterales bacterium]